jgi:hypothetical protein
MYNDLQRWNKSNQIKFTFILILLIVNSYFHKLYKGHSNNLYETDGRFSDILSTLTYSMSRR